jgi:hypothetical protein
MKFRKLSGIRKNAYTARCVALMRILRTLRANGGVRHVETRAWTLRIALKILTPPLEKPHPLLPQNVGQY